MIGRRVQPWDAGFSELVATVALRREQDRLSEVVDALRERHPQVPLLSTPRLCAGLRPCLNRASRKKHVIPWTAWSAPSSGPCRATSVGRTPWSTWPMRPSHFATMTTLHAIATQLAPFAWHPRVGVGGGRRGAGQPGAGPAGCVRGSDRRSARVSRRSGGVGHGDGRRPLDDRVRVERADALLERDAEGDRDSGRDHPRWVPGAVSLPSGSSPWRRRIGGDSRDGAVRTPGMGSRRRSAGEPD